ncbi:amidase domain-containing protein [Caloramator sp. E03]|uniref:amidase domain-containing protein n=1 Tax=Caloramator sp. E03 TaxID=2576307 RepID=UPI001A9ABB2F|nr:amidase domain-containing protein [Caloramator sp. E03]
MSYDFLRNNLYSRFDAVRYAYTYGITPNPKYRYFQGHADGGGDCTNFISQCLKAGGAPMDYSGTWAWWYNNKSTDNLYDDSWSVTWSVANSLYWCLKSRYQLKLPGLKALEVQDLDLLELGDIIQYENFRGFIYHSAIITAFTYNGGIRIPLITQHTFDAINTSYIKPAAKRMHFMKIIVN